MATATGCSEQGNVTIPELSGAIGLRAKDTKAADPVKGTGISGFVSASGHRSAATNSGAADGPVLVCHATQHSHVGTAK
jgi:hypothetical protein